MEVERNNKRSRINQDEYDQIGFKKVHYDNISNNKLKEEKKIYRCTIINCSFVACTPHNMSNHIKTHYHVDQPQ